MIKEMLKTAGVDNMEDFYKLHPTEEHFFKTYPHMKDKVKKGKKIRRAQKGGLMSNSLSRPSVPIDYHSQTAANKMHFGDGGMHSNALHPTSPAMNLDYRAGSYAAPKLRMQEGGDPQQEMMQQVMQMISGALEQGAEPKQVMQMLVQQGIPAEAAQQLMQVVMQQMSGAQEEYADGGRLPREVLRSRLESHMSPSEADEYLSTYAKGGIHIDPAKKGTFRAQATRMGMSVKEAARHIMANKENYSPAMVKKAVFAHNFAKQDGGYTYQQGGKTIMLPSHQHYTPSAVDSLLRNPTMNQEANRYFDSLMQNRQPVHMHKRMQEGGEAMPQEMMEAPQEQMQEQAMGQEQQPQGGGQDQMMQQLMQMVMQALQQGMQPEQIIQMLVQQGVPQEVAVQLVQMVMQQMQGGAPQGGPGQQYQPQGEQYQGPQAMAAYGGMYQVGGVTPQGAGTHSQQYTIRNGVAIPTGAYGGYYADGGFFNEGYMPFDY